MFKRLFGIALFVALLTLLFSVFFSTGVFAATYEIAHDDEVEQVRQLQSQKYSYSQEMGGYRSYNAYDTSYDTNALRDDLYFYEVNDANRDSRLRNDINKGFENLAEKGVWSGHRELCRDWDWMYDTFYLRVDDDHEFFRFVKSCDDDPGFSDWWYNYWEQGYFFNGPETPSWWMPQDGSRVCWKAKNYAEFLECRNTFLPHYRVDSPPGYFSHDGSIDYGKNAYKQWADTCAEEMEGGYVSDWCWKRRWWITGTVSN